MNILKITIGHEWDNDYSEFLFKTNRPKEDFYDCNFNITEFFMNWLKEHNNWLYERVNEGVMDDIYYYHEDSLDEI